MKDRLNFLAVLALSTLIACSDENEATPLAGLPETPAVPDAPPGQPGGDRPSDGGGEETLPSEGVLAPCRAVQGSNADGTSRLDLRGYLELAGEKYKGKGAFPGREKVYAYTPAESGVVTLSLKSRSRAFDAALYVLSAEENDASLLLGALESTGHRYRDYLQTHRLLTERALGDYFDGGQAEHITMRVEAGTTYFVVVDSAWTEASGHGTGSFELKLFDATCPCAELSRAALCSSAECGSVSKVDSCGRTSGQYDLLGNYSVEQVACGGCSEGRCDALVHQCAAVEVATIEASCMRIQDTNRDGRAQFRVTSGEIDLTGKEKLYAYTPVVSGPFSVVLRGEGETFDGALYALSSIEGTPEVTHLSDTFAAGYAEALRLDGTAGQTVYFAVDAAWDEGDYSLEIADETCPCRALAKKALCTGYAPACGGVFRVDSCGVHALNADGSMAIEPCRECAGGMCDLEVNQCVEVATPAVEACGTIRGDTTGGPTLFTNETWAEYGLIFAAGPEAYATHTPATSGTVTVTLSEAAFRWYLSVYSNSTFSNLIGYRDYYYGKNDPSVTFEAEAGKTYYFVVDGETLSDAGTFSIEVTRKECD